MDCSFMQSGIATEEPRWKEEKAENGESFSVEGEGPKVFSLRVKCCVPGELKGEVVVGQIKARCGVIIEAPQTNKLLLARGMHKANRISNNFPRD